MADIGDDRYVEIADKFALIIVVDVSDSMKNHIDEITDSINTILDIAKDNQRVCREMDVEIITFSDDVETYQEWSTLDYVSLSKFETGGKCNLRDAMIRAMGDIKQRMHDYRTINEIRIRMPWIVLISGGFSDKNEPVDEIAAKIRRAEMYGEVSIISLGVGTEFNRYELGKFGGVSALDDMDFINFVDHLGDVYCDDIIMLPDERTPIGDDEDLLDMEIAFGKCGGLICNDDDITDTDGVFNRFKPFRSVDEDSSDEVYKETESPFESKSLGDDENSTDDEFQMDMEKAFRKFRDSYKYYDFD